MVLWFSSVCYKRDAAGKIHLWGILSEKANNVIEDHIFWGRSDARAYISPICWSSRDLYSKKIRKVAEGYKEITQSLVERKWPEFMGDIEMQIMIKRLKNE